MTTYNCWSEKWTALKYGLFSDEDWENEYERLIGE